MNKRKRVVVTGLGVISQAGNNVKEFHKNIIAGKKPYCGTFSPQRIKGSYCAYYGMLDEENIYKTASERGIDLDSIDAGKCSKLAILAADEAIKDSGLKITDENSDSVSVLIGSAYGENYGYENLSSSDNTVYRNNEISASVARYIGASGDIFTNLNACSAGNISIAYGYELICSGRSDTAVVGAADVYSDIIYGGFTRIKILSKEHTMPFDKNRDGIIISEGAGCMILEDYESALKRNAHIYCEILGVGMSNDAFNLLAPDPEGKGAEKAIRTALDEAKCKPEDIDYISLHGTGTQTNDICESIAIKNVFGEKAGNIYASSLKGLMGHNLGSASLLSSISCALTIQHGIIPLTANTKDIIHECPVDLVTGESIKTNVDIAMNNAFAFGGSNCIVIYSKCK
jgi:3-oxoacyl-[acyl-carrier-protein] synthase II